MKVGFTVGLIAKENRKKQMVNLLLGDRSSIEERQSMRAEVPQHLWQYVIVVRNPDSFKAI